MALVKMLVLCSSIGWASFEDLMNVAVHHSLLGTGILRGARRLAMFLCLEELRVLLGMCKGFESLPIFSYIPILYIHSKVIQSRPLSFHH